MSDYTQDLQVIKDVVGYEGIFSITKNGMVFSKRSQKFLAYYTNNNGYREISSKIGGRTGKCICIRIHRMVAESFIPNPENKPFVNHIDGNKQNNHVDNLEWVTALENSQHAWSTGLINKNMMTGESRGNISLNRDQVLYIRSVYISRSKEFGCKALALKFGVSRFIISNIINYNTWKHV